MSEVQIDFGNESVMRIERALDELQEFYSPGGGKSSDQEHVDKKAEVQCLVREAIQEIDPEIIPEKIQKMRLSDWAIGSELVLSKDRGRWPHIEPRNILLAFEAGEEKAT